MSNPSHLSTVHAELGKLIGPFFPVFSNCFFLLKFGVQIECKNKKEKKKSLCDLGFNIY